MAKYSRVYWICIFEGVESLFTRWDFFLSIYWGSRLDILLFILFFLSIDREFFDNLFYFWDLVRRSGISETLYH